jgi:hypothetical protein
MFRKIVLFGIACCVLMMGAGAVIAQDEMESIASELSAPRHLFYGADGTLYIAEAGMGGELTAPNYNGSGEVSLGLTARVSTVSPDGEQGILFDELLSTTDAFGFSLAGVSAVHVDATSAWLVMGQGPQRDSLPTEISGYFSALVQVDLETMEVVHVVDLLAYEEENNPDATLEIASNPQDIAVAEDGTVYIVDASANAMYTWTADDGLTLFIVWEVDDTGAEPSPVPTSVEIAEDGSLYIGFLSGFPFLPGAASIEHWSAEGELIGIIEGLTLVTDIEIGQDGNLYAVQFADGFGDAGYNANTGSVVMISEDGVVTPVMEGLSFPYGIAQDADGNWVVSVNSGFSAPGSGAVIPVVSGM